MTNKKGLVTSYEAFFILVLRLITSPKLSLDRYSSTTQLGFPMPL